MEPSLKTAVAGVRRATGMPVAFAGRVLPSGDRYAISQSSGCLTGVLDGLVIHSGNGLGGQVLAEARIHTVTDYLRDERITHQYDGPVAKEHLQSIVGAPVVVAGSVRAVLYGAVRSAGTIGSRTLDAMRACAQQVAFELAVSEATTRRLRTIETAAIIRDAHEAPTHPEWEDVRVAHAELRALAGTIGDEDLRDRLAGIAARLTSRGEPAPRVTLTAREIDVLALVAIGGTNAEIAVRLDLSIETVKSYLRSAMRKLDAHRRVEAVTRARAAGLLP